MSNNNFNGTDIALQFLANLIGKPIADSLKQIGFTEQQINITGAIFVYTASKNILSNYLKGFNLYQGEVLALKQYILAMQDSEVTQKISHFLQYPSVATAKEALNEVEKSEAKYLAQQITTKPEEDKK